MTRPGPTRALGVFGLLFALIGGMALAFAAWGIATLQTPAESLGADASPADAQEALERFRLRLDLNARLQGSGLGFIAAGLVCVAAGKRPTGDGRHLAAAVVGTLAAVAIIIGRWSSVSADQFGPRWDHWVLVEAVGWAFWSATLVLLLAREALPATGQRGAA